MSHVELVDDVHSRRIRVPALKGPIRIELDGETTRVVVPETVEVVREAVDSTNAAFEDPSGSDAVRSRGWRP